MEKLIEKIGSYNLFNYLFPGTVFVYVTKAIVSVDLVQTDIVLGFFLYYFLGMLISRIGSLILEPIVKVVLRIKFSDYKDYVSASKKDDKISVFLEVNNTYRTLIALPIVVGLVWCWTLLRIQLSIPNEFGYGALLTILVILFSVSFKKQSGFINKRVEISK